MRKKFYIILFSFMIFSTITVIKIFYRSVNHSNCHLLQNHLSMCSIDSAGMKWNDKKISSIRNIFHWFVDHHKDNMLNYREPTYSILNISPSFYKVAVEVKEGKEAPDKIEQSREKILFQEAEKCPLFAMAFVQKLAIDGDSQAQSLREIYQSYRQFLENSDKDKFQATIDNIIRKNTDSLSQNIALYLNAILNDQEIDLSLKNAGNLINQLIPGIDQILTMPLPKKICEEQEVIYPGMDESLHKAFPDLIKFQGHYYAAFREAHSHVRYKDFGKIRILKGDLIKNDCLFKWETMALLDKEDYDLRDPKFFVNKKNELQMIMGGSKINENDETILMTPHIANLNNGRWQLSEAIIDPETNGPKGQWIWRVTWNPYDNSGYALSYGKENLSLMKTVDGMKYEKIAEITYEPQVLSEGTLRFKSDGTAIALIRGKKIGIIGISKPIDKYKKWILHLVPFRLGGPNFLIKDDGTMWAATRHYFLNEDNTLDEATIVGLMNENSLIPALRLKSHFDNSYPGMVMEEDGSVTILYYSGESEEKTNLYMTSVTTPSQEQ